MILQEAQEKVTKNKGALELLYTTLDQQRSEKRLLKHKLKTIEYSKLLVQKAADETQQELEYRIGSLVTLALQSIFDKRYTCKIEFVPRRGKIEADIILNKDSLIIDDVMEASGGGVGDVMSFALRISLWALKKNRPLFILDEPFKFVDKKRLAKCYTLLSELSKDLHIQFIIVSHEDEMIYPCDLEIPVIENENVIVNGENHDQETI